MKRILLLCVLLMSWHLTACASDQSILNSSAEVITGRVVSISDGDTFHILTHETCNVSNSSTACKDGYMQYRVRMAQIDAPEKGQAYGKKAKEILSSMIFDQDATLYVIDTDKYQRKVVDVYVNNVWINQEMVRIGAVWVYRKYIRDEGLIAIEDRARAAHTGLWGLPAHERLPPWEWRQKKRSK